MIEQQKKTVTVALAGVPNTGKSTVFSALTGLHQRVGNWPGKTVEKKSGLRRRDGAVFRLVDLPGSYTLCATSSEEEVARDFLVQERPDVLVVIVDASGLERSLYLLCELLELRLPTVIALNMMDVADRSGLRIDVETLQRLLGAPVVPMVARSGRGLERLLDAIDTVAKHGRPPAVAGHSVPQTLQTAMSRLEDLLPQSLSLPCSNRWVAMKLLEGDAALTSEVRHAVSPEIAEAIEVVLKENGEAFLEIAGSRYDWAAAAHRQVVRRDGTGRTAGGEKIDKLLTHPLGGVASFLAIVFGVYWLMFGIGAPIQRWLSVRVVGDTGNFMEAHLAAWPDWSVSLLTDGIIGGAGLVLTFVPILAILFFAMSALEDVGYMARAALVMDRFMNRIGLRGKSFLPLFMGWGCNVPAIMGTRIIEPKTARLTTVLVAPFVPCAARMVVIALFAAAFFGGAAAFVSWAMVALNLAVLAIAALLINRFVVKGEPSSFMIELPRYHTPNLHTLLMTTWVRLKGFIVLAGTLILAMSLLVWALSTFPTNEIEGSFLGHVGRGLEPLGGLMGLDWRMMVALLTSLVSKEQTIATLGVIFGTSGDAALEANLTAILAPAAAVSFIALQMLFIPCVASTAAIRRETGSWKWTAFAISYMLAISFIVAMVIYQGARLVGVGV